MTYDYRPEILTKIDSNQCFERNEKGKPSILPGSALADILVKHTSLKYMRCYSKTGLMYCYLTKEKFYLPIHKSQMTGIVNKALSPILAPKYRTHSILGEIANSLLVHEDLCREGDPGEEIDQGYISCKNGLLSVETADITEHTPEKFVTSYFPHEYSGKTPIPNFMLYLNQISDGDQDKIAFFQCVLKLLVTSNTLYQVFVYIWGKGGSGKSTFASVCSALVGDHSTHATTLKAMNTDKFEPINFLGMKLILIGDSEVYTNDLSGLKALTGGDPLRGRAMYKTATENVYLEGLVLITGNKLIATKDTSNAILRRIRPIEVSTVPEKVETLLYTKGGKISGLLAPELPGIMAFALEPDESKLDRYIKEFRLRPTLQEGLTDAALSMNPALQWVSEEIQRGNGAYLGCASSNKKDQRESMYRMTLYPAYLNYCKRVGVSVQLSQKTFSEHLTNACEILGMPAKLRRRSTGRYVEGIVLRPDVYNPNIQYGAPLGDEETGSQTTEVYVDQFPRNQYEDPKLTTEQAKEREDQALKLEKLESETSNFKQLDLINSIQAKRPETKNLNSLSKLQRLEPFYATSEPQYIHKELAPNFIETYTRHLNNINPLYREINRYTRHIDVKIAEKEIMEAMVFPKDATTEYIEGIRSQVAKSAIKISKYGVIPRSYKPMGISPRLCPVAYGKSINSTKKVARAYYYAKAADFLSTKGFVLIDFDLKSCYISTLMGTFPNYFYTISKQIKKGLWDSFERDFKAQGKGDVFNKPAVKICTYASLFQGGKKAMTEGIMKYFSDQAGMTSAQFKESPIFERTERICNGVVKLMLEHPFIQDFTGLSKELLQTYDSNYLVGPSGHRYFITPEYFKHLFPCYLQSFEISLLAESTNRVIRKFPEVGVVGHYHDGNVLIVPSEMEEKVIEHYKQTVTKLGYDLGLKFPQEVEVQEVFKPSGKIIVEDLFDTSMFETQGN